MVIESVRDWFERDDDVLIPTSIIGHIRAVYWPSCGRDKGRGIVANKDGVGAILYVNVDGNDWIMEFSPSGELFAWHNPKYVETIIWEGGEENECQRIRA